MTGDTLFPNSKIPFNPINPHGSRARYPDGRRAGLDAPPGWKSPLREPLYQVHVEDKDRGHIPIGPKVRNDIASQLCAAVQTAIKSGRVTGWANPYVMRAPPEQVRWGAV